MTEGSTVTTTKYMEGGYQYENNVLKFFPHAEGYVTKEGSNTYRYVFTYSDHLGNIRLKYCDLNQNGSIETNEILEENHYYPFGLKHEGYNGDVLALANKHKYNGKEYQDELGLNMYDYGARNYDPAIGRWMNIDPLAEVSRHWTPYRYAYNNPLIFIDPDGMLENDDWVLGSDNKIRWDKDANSPETTTRAGDIYMGKTINLEFNSYIDGGLWDGPMGDSPVGDKLTTTVSITGNENEKGELTGITATKSVKVGDTPIGTARDFYPGEGGNNNILSSSSTKSGINITMEQHASVSPIEEFGMNRMGYRIVDVAQKLDINYSSTTGGLSIDSYTGIFPSATLKITDSQNSVSAQIMKYNQPSFVKTHSAPIIKSSYLPNQSQGRDFSYYPTRFFKR